MSDASSPEATSLSAYHHVCMPNNRPSIFTQVSHNDHLLAETIYLSSVWAGPPKPYAFHDKMNKSESKKNHIHKLKQGYQAGWYDRRRKYQPSQKNLCKERTKCNGNWKKIQKSIDQQKRANVNSCIVIHVYMEHNMIIYHKNIKNILNFTWPEL